MGLFAELDGICMTMKIDVPPTVEPAGGSIFNSIGFPIDDNASAEWDRSRGGNCAASMRASAARRKLDRIGVVAATKAARAVGGNDCIGEGHESVRNSGLASS